MPIQPDTSIMTTWPIERPRGITEIVSEAFNIYGKAFINFWIPFLIIGIVFGFINSFLNIAFYELLEDIATGNSIDFGEMVINLFISSFILIGLAFISDAIATGMIVTMVKPVASNQLAPTLSEAFQRVMRVLPRLILASFLFGLLLVAGFIFLIIPGLIFLTWFYLISVCIVLEDESATGSFTRSRSLVQGDGWHTFGVIFFSFIVILIFQVVLGLFVGIIIPFDTFYNGRDQISYILGTLILFITDSLITPLGGIITTLLYFDLKARKEQKPLRGEPYTYTPTLSPPSAKFCSNCGATLPTDPTHSHCTECGTKFR